MCIIIKPFLHNTWLCRSTRNYRRKTRDVKVKKGGKGPEKERKLAPLEIIRTFPRFNCNKNCLKGQSRPSRNKEINYIIQPITHRTAAIRASTIFAEDQVHQKLRELKKKKFIIVTEYPSSSEPAGRTQTERLLMFLLQPNTPAQ